MAEKRFVENPLALCSLFWNEDWTFDKQGFAENVEALLARKKFVPYICCTAGEGYALSHKNYAEIVKTFADLTKGYDLPVIAGVISTSLQEMHERVELAVEAGITNIMFPLPSWGVMNPGEINSFIDHFFSAHPNCNFIHYNNSDRSRVRLYAADYARIVEKHPNFVAVKQCYATQVDPIMMAQMDLPVVEYYLEYMYTVACLYGTPSLLPSTLCLNYDVALEYYEAGRRKDFATLTKIDQQILRAGQALGETLPGGLIDGAYDKCFDRMHNPKLSQRLYPPYQAPTDEEFFAYAALVKERVPEWF